MESVTDAASAVAYARGVQHSLNTLMTLQVFSYLWMPECQIPDNEYDYIVVGAGTSGAIVASRLAQNKAKVLLIEAGGDPPLESILPGLVVYVVSSQIDYNFTTTTKRFHKQCGRDGSFPLHAGKTLGGSSSLNFFSYARGNDRDYESWVKASKNPQWSFNNTLKYFKRTEKLEIESILNSPFYSQYHGVDGPLIVTKDRRIVGFKKSFEAILGQAVVDLNSNETLGLSKVQITISDRRESSATAFLKANDTNPYLALLKHTEVIKILFDSNNNAVGVEAIRNNKVVTFKARKEVILAAGVINTPKLLMLSGIGPKKHLECKGIKVLADLPVGENYHDHVSVAVVHKLGKYSGHMDEVDFRKYPYPAIEAYVALNKSNKYPDYAATGYFLFNKNAAKEALIDNAFYHHYSNCILKRIYKKTEGYEQLYMYIKNTTPQSRGSVTLRSSDHKDKPKIVGGFFDKEEDLEAFVDYLEQYIKIGDTDQFKEVGAELVDPFDKNCGGHKFGTREYWKCYVLCMMTPSNHAVGTCAMGSVVDGELKVLGVNRCRVVDASVIPVITSGATSAPTMMIGEKAADLILKKKS